MTVLGLKCLTISNQFCVHRPSCSFSLIFHIDIVCVCVCVCSFVRSSSPLNTVVSWTPALGLRPEQILRVEVQW